MRVMSLRATEDGVEPPVLLHNVYMKKKEYSHVMNSAS